jgi:hypothetical protein
MEVTLTAKLRLDLPLEVASALVRVYTHACNFASEVAFCSKRPSSRDALNRLAVRYVDPAYTSQGCSRCGYTTPANRYGLRFRCGACRLQIHADLNGARNVRLRGILARQVPREDGAPSVAPEVPGSPGQAHAITPQG